MRLDLLAWLAQFDSEQERMLCFDYAGDWDLFVDLVGDVLDGWLACHIGQALSAERSEMYVGEHGGRHHALHDARANRHATQG